jgi:hypothetical protein
MQNPTIKENMGTVTVTNIPFLSWWAQGYCKIFTILALSNLETLFLRTHMILVTRFGTHDGTLSLQAHTLLICFI